MLVTVKSKTVKSTPARSPRRAARAPKRPGGRFLRRWGPVLFLLLVAAAAAFPWLWQAWVEARYAARIYQPEAAPPARVALVFGARVYRDSRLSAMLRDRVDTAVDLYFAGKVDKLLLSGGQNGEDYDEPAAMMAHALARGVPPEALQPDYGGLRTYDSCYRAVEIFQVQSAILVTQEFHLPRALLLCDNLGMEVVGVVADRRVYGQRSIAWSETREVPALVGALVDLVRRAPPPILGDPIPLN